MKSIGFTPWDMAADAPYQPQLRLNSKPRPKPITVYRTAALAAGYSADGFSMEVFVKG